MSRTLRRSTILETNRRSFAGEIPFPQVVLALQQCGVERYTVDLCTFVTTYYAADGESFAVPLPLDDAPRVCEAWSAEEIIAAIRASQQKEIGYPEFLHRVMAAGCVAYFAYLRGRQVTYTSRLGDQHVERFPASSQ